MDRAALKRWVYGDFSWKRLLRSLVIIYLCFAAFAWFFSERLMFHPEMSFNREPAGTVAVPTADGATIAVTYLPVAGARDTILFSHGNAEDVGDLRSSLFERLNRLGFSVLAYDYRGYGASTGTPTEAGTYQDIDAAYTYLTGNLGVPPDRIIVYGRSIGSGPSTDLAAREPVGGLVLESAFVSVFRVRTVIPLLPFDRFDNLAKIDRIACPLLVLHGTEDELIPLWHAQKLLARAKEPKRGVWFAGAGHGDVPFVAPKRYDEALRGFASRVDASR